MSNDINQMMTAARFHVSSHGVDRNMREQIELACLWFLVGNSGHRMSMSQLLRRPESFKTVWVWGAVQEMMPAFHVKQHQVRAALKRLEAKGLVINWSHRVNEAAWRYLPEAERLERARVAKDAEKAEKTARKAVKMLSKAGYPVEASTSKGQVVLKMSPEILMGLASFVYDRLTVH